MQAVVCGIINQSKSIQPWYIKFQFNPFSFTSNIPPRWRCGFIISVHVRSARCGSKSVESDYLPSIVSAFRLAITVDPTRASVQQGGVTANSNGRQPPLLFVSSPTFYLSCSPYYYHHHQ